MRRIRTSLAVVAVGFVIMSCSTDRAPRPSAQQVETVDTSTTTTIDPEALADFAAAVALHELTVFAEAVEQHEASVRAERARQASPQVEGTSGTSGTVAVIPEGSVWDRLAVCEAGGNWAHPPVGPMTGNPSSYSGGLMFDYRTWNSYGGQEFAPAAWQASREAQIVVAERILADVGWGAWPACSRKLGLR